MREISEDASLVLSQYKPKDVAKAIEYLDTDGYFSYDECFEEYEEGTLRTIKITGAKIEDEYYFYNDDTPYPYFIPKGEVVFKPEEKKYRPYDTLDDLPFEVGDAIRISRNPIGEVQHRVIVSEITYDGSEEVLSITLGSGITYEPNDLLETFAIFIDNQWQPMGVEE